MLHFRRLFRSLGALVAVAFCVAHAAVPAALAGEADVIKVEVRRSAAGTYAFDVTVRHADTGWDHYADAWDIVAPDGETVLGTRKLLHPHENEQPFTRSLSGVRIPDGIDEVIVRARDSVHGYGGAEIRIRIER